MKLPVILCTLQAQMLSVLFLITSLPSVTDIRPLCLASSTADFSLIYPPALQHLLPKASNRKHRCNNNHMIMLPSLLYTILLLDVSAFMTNTE